MNGDVKLILGAVREASREHTKRLDVMAEKGEERSRQLTLMAERLGMLPCKEHLEKITGVESTLSDVDALLRQRQPAIMSLTSPFGSVSGGPLAVIAAVVVVSFIAGCFWVIKDTRSTRADIRKMLNPVVLEKLVVGKNGSGHPGGGG